MPGKNPHTAASPARTIREPAAAASEASARPAGSAHPQVHLWDNGANAAEELANVMEVRSIALTDFGEHNVVEGTPLAELQETFALVYFFHRYQVEAAAKLVGGVDYRFNLAGDGQELSLPLLAEEQRAALQAVLATLDPVELDVSEDRMPTVEMFTPQGMESMGINLKDMFGGLMGRKARKFVRENFLITRHLREYLTLMLALTNGARERIELA